MGGTRRGFLRVDGHCLRRGLEQETGESIDELELDAWVREVGGEVERPPLPRSRGIGRDRFVRRQASPQPLVYWLPADRFGRVPS